MAIAAFNNADARSARTGRPRRATATRGTDAYCDADARAVDHGRSPAFPICFDRIQHACTACDAPSR